MKTVWGIDLGVASIGWAIIQTPKKKGENGKILHTGVRVIPLEKSGSDFVTGTSGALNADRTQARGMRRNQYRWKLRRKRLRGILAAHDMLPSDELMHMDKLSLWQLRARAVTEKVSLTELGRVLLHLLQKRGYQSNRKTQAQEKNASDYLQAIASRSSLLDQRQQTIGQYFAEQLTADPHFRTREFILLRSDYRHEYDQIWKTQSDHHEELTDELYEEIGPRTLFYQRPLKSQKNNVSRCAFEPHLRVIPESSPYYQLFRIYQMVNNLVVRDQDLTELKLTDEHRYALVEALMDTEKLKTNKIKKALGLKPAARYTLNYEELIGNRTRARLLRAMEKTGYHTHELLDVDLTIETSDEDPAYRFWHLLYSVDSAEDIQRILMTNYGMNAEQAQAVEQVRLEDGYGNLSHKVIRKILPDMKAGKEYSEAMSAAGYNHSHSMTVGERNERELLDRVPLVKKNALKNASVEKILNQLATLVNKMLDVYGRPDEIRVELARELKQNAKKRKKITSNNKLKNKRNTNITKLLQEKLGMSRVSLRSIQKYKLWEETDHICLYTGKTIPLADLYDRSQYDIEHIIPKAKIFDDSMMNKIVSDRKANADKGDRTAIAYMETLGEKAVSAYVQRVKDLVKDERKRERLLMTDDEIPTEFLNRHLKQSQYIAKYAIGMLEQIAPYVSSTSGAVTSHLRHIWGLNTLMEDISRYAGDKDWHKRDDHRHHAVDAVVVACTSQAIITHLNTLNRNQGATEAIAQGWKVNPPWDSLRQDTMASIEKILVSVKPGKRAATMSRNVYKTRKGKMTHRQLVPRGRLHEETMHAQRLRYVKDPVKIRGSFRDAELIIDDIIREAVLDRLNKYDGDPKKAFKALSKNPILHPETGEPITEVFVFERVYTVRKPITIEFKDEDRIIDSAVKRIVLERLARFGGNRKKAYANLEDDPIWLNQEGGIAIKRVSVSSKVSRDLDSVRSSVERGEDKDFVQLGNNHHVAIYRDEVGKYHEKVVSLWEAYERKAKGDPYIAQINEEGWTLVMSMQQNEMFLFGLDPDELPNPDTEKSLISEHLYRVQKLSKKEYVFRHHLATSIDHDRDEISIWSINEELLNAVKCKIDHLGRISYE